MPRTEKEGHIQLLRYMAGMFRTAPREGNEADEAEREDLYLVQMPEPLGKFTNKAALLAADALEAAAKALEAAE